MKIEPICNTLLREYLDIEYEIEKCEDQVTYQIKLKECKANRIETVHLCCWYTGM